MKKTIRILAGGALVCGALSVALLCAACDNGEFWERQEPKPEAGRSYAFVAVCTNRVY
jgi:hypothetical protein